MSSIDTDAHLMDKLKLKPDDVLTPDGGWS